ncbi:VOC family protein [Hymenobacter properus]|uniref:VOC family protein n=1 Tax=Hymenobacter properus TaxID=2791026 RepID=A0A931FJ61_9BACT|nr:VOC family protein [Hymenobacter properus]MBF9142677.1 VOC family protein [Hymenobacter properus]MBR7721485.1 VOC family protein [Microvirga sp. SRT04]
MLQGLRTVVYPVGDLAKATAWYSTALEQAPYFEEPFYVGFNVGGYELGLIPQNTAAGQAGPTAYWGVPDAAAAYARLLELGAHPSEEVQDVGSGILVGAVLDPFGNLLGVIQNPHFKLPA